jgi:Na+/H+ antiporter NhaD/arsenite permease-like protein
VPATREIHPATPSHAWRQRVAHDYLLWTLLALVAILALVDPRPPRAYLGWLDLPTLAGLCGLLVLTQGVLASGHVQRLALQLVARLRHVRALAFVLVLLAAALATALTNDVALFLVVPLTLAIDRVARIPRQRLVIFEALAVNAGSTFSPIGNPQNLLLWQHSGLGFFGYVAALAPTGAVLLAVLLIACRLAFPATPLRFDAAAATPAPVDTPLLVGALVLLAALVAALQFKLAVLAALLVLAIAGLCFRRVLREVDWPLLVTSPPCSSVSATLRRCPWCRRTSARWHGTTRASRTRAASCCRRSSATCRPPCCCSTTPPTSRCSPPRSTWAAPGLRSARWPT